MSTQQYDETDLEDFYVDEEPETPRRPRRGLVTPVTGGLVAVALVAGGFVGGVQVQKRQGGSSSGARGGLPSGLTARMGQQGQQQGNATTGTVTNVKGSTLYVTTSDGTTVKIKTDDNSKVTRNAASSAANVHPGDSVVIQGEKSANGSVTASSITATAKGVSSGGLPAMGGGANLQVPDGFAPPTG